jgi:hypothetical protein
MPRKGTTTQRGYGAKHKAQRRKYEPIVKSGRAICWRCGLPIRPDEPWDTGHDDYDRGTYRGPEHATCNRRAGANMGNLKRWGKRAKTPARRWAL